MTTYVLGPHGRIDEVTGPVVSADDPGLIRGESVFETLTVGRGGPVLLAEHLTRMHTSAAAMGLELPTVQDLRRLAEAAKPATVLRLVVTRGRVAMAVVSPLPDHAVARAEGIVVVTLSLGMPAGLRPEAPWLLGGVKSTSYAVAMAGLREATRRGAHDALWTSVEGEVLEATTANLAWVTGDVLHTVDPVSTGVLDGTTVRWALAASGLATRLHRASLAEVLAADEVMLTSSVRGVVGVRLLDARDYGPPGPVTRVLQSEWAALTGLG